MGRRSPDDCPEEVAALVKECLEPDPRNRPTAKDVSVRLKAATLGPSERCDGPSVASAFDTRGTGATTSGVTLRNYSSSNLKNVPSFSKLAGIRRKISAPEAFPAQALTDDTAHMPILGSVAAGRAASVGATSTAPLAAGVSKPLDRAGRDLPLPAGPGAGNTLDETRRTTAAAADTDVDAHVDIPESWIREEGPQSPYSP